MIYINKDIQRKMYMYIEHVQIYNELKNIYSYGMYNIHKKRSERYIHGDIQI